MARTIIGAVRTIAERWPQRPAITAGDQCVSYARLLEQTDRLAGHLAGSASTVALLCGNAPQFAFGLLGALAAGKTVAVLPTLAPPPLLAMMCAEAGAGSILASADLAPRAREAGAATQVIEDLLAGPAAGAGPPVSAERRSPAAVLLYTSGSTGRPKAVALSDENVLSNIDGCVGAMKFTSDEVMLAILPLFHSYGLVVTLLLPLTLGGRVVLEKFTPRGVLTAIERHRVTALIAVPSQYRLLAKDTAPADISSLRYLIAGAERLPEIVSIEFEARFGKRIMEGYGCTEATPVIAINPPWANRAGSVGPGLPNLRLTIREDGVEVPTGAQGEICIAGPNVMLGYHNQPEATAAKIRNGVLRTGDRGFLDVDGYLHIAGRADDMLKIAGEKIYPAEVEQGIEKIDGVEEAAVVGVPDETRGIALIAYVQPKPGFALTEAGLRMAAREHLEAIKIPRSFVVLEQLPRTATGKLDKKALAQSND
jgi:long-chain acyl-CoA synthetase